MTQQELLTALLSLKADAVNLNGKMDLVLAAIDSLKATITALQAGQLPQAFTDVVNDLISNLGSLNTKMDQALL